MSESPETIASQVGAMTRELAVRYLHQVDTPGVKVSLGCINLAGLDVWVIASKSERVLAETRESVAAALRAHLAERVDELGPTKELTDAAGEAVSHPDTSPASPAADATIRPPPD